MAAKKTLTVLELRKSTGLSQTAFWTRFGVTQSGGSRYESGRRLPKPLSILMELIATNTITEAQLQAAAAPKKVAAKKATGATTQVVA